MPSIQAQFNEEVIQAHREALQALRELLAEETDPLERRRLAIAILRARPVKDTEPPPPAPDAAGDRALGSKAHESQKSRRTRRGNSSGSFAAADEGASAPAPITPRAAEPIDRFRRPTTPAAGTLAAHAGTNTPAPHTPQNHTSPPPPKTQPRREPVGMGSNAAA
ncbi:MAG: hypothetical protein Q8L55_13330 [Phycisphaerales bacterium]|nr:hypothetical protein [Phycisphaerales bacterium]